MRTTGSIGTPDVFPPTTEAELSDSDLAAVVAGKEGGFGRKVLWAMYSSSGFYPGSNEPWRSTGVM